MSTERVATNVVRWETDQSALNKTLQGAKRVADAQLDAAGANKALAKSSKIADQSFDRLTRQSRELTDSYNNIERAALGAADAQQRSGDVVGRGDTALSALGTLGATLGIEQAEFLSAGADVLAVTDALKAFKAALITTEAAEAGAAAGAAGFSLALGPIAAIGIAVAAAVAAAGVAISALNEQYDEQRKAAERAAERIRTFNQASRELTTEEVVKRREEANDKLLAAEQNLNDLRAEQQRLWADESSFILGDLGARVRTALGQSAFGAEKLNDAISEQEKAVQSARAEMEGYDQALATNATATNDVAEAERRLTNERIIAAREIAEAEARRTELLRSGTLQSIKDEIDRRRTAIAQIDTELTELRKLDQTNEDVIARTQELLVERGKESKALADLLAGILPVVAAREAESAAVAQQVAAIQTATDNELERGEILKGLTTEQRQAELERAQTTINALREQRAALMELDQSSEEVKAALAGVDAQLKEAESSFQFYSGAAARSAAQTNEIAAIEKERADKTENITSKLADETARIEQQAAEKRADAQQKYADDLVSITQQAAQDSEDALWQLRQERANIARDTNRDLANIARDAALERMDAQIEAQRDEARAFREHADRLQDLRRRKQFEEFDLIANRDFAGLFRSRRQFAFDQETLGIEAGRGQRERQIAAQQQIDDITRNAERERQARLQQYQQQLQDAQIAFDRERELIRINKQRELAELQRSYQREQELLAQKTQQELQLKRSAAQQELQLIQQAAQQRVQLQQQANQSILQQFANFFPALQGLANRAQQIFNQNQVNTNITIPTQATAGDVARVAGFVLGNVLRREF